LREGGVEANHKRMADRKPTDDLREGLFLLYRAARGAAKGVAKEIDASRVEKAVNEGASELARVVTTIGKTLGSELEKTFSSRDDPGHHKPDDQGPPPGSPPKL
jgi:hypothetical protein